MIEREPSNVCDGCWKRGLCSRRAWDSEAKRLTECTCPCTTAGWRHTDEPKEK